MGPACMLQERWAEKGAELVCAPSSPKKPDVEPDASEGGWRRQALPALWHWTAPVRNCPHQ